MGRGLTRGVVVCLLATALIGAWAASFARADGDPASDYLVTNQVFLTSESAPVSPAERQLVALVRTANQDGFAIRVALVSTDYDLGSITELWLKPSLYARFLGLELSPVYKQRLLVVMPNGFGFNWPGHSSAAASRTLAGVPAGENGGAVALAAQSAVQRLAAAAGVRLALPSSGGGSSGAPWLPIVAIVVASGVLVAIAAFVGVPRARRRWRARPRRERPAHGDGVPPGGRGLPVRLRWLLPGTVVLGAAAIATPILLLRHGGTPVSDAAVVTPPPLSWHAGQRAAPAFELRDQNGQPVSLAAYRVRPVILTFVDPLCRNLCPLEAQVLNQTLRGMPASQRPEIVAVSVDVWADTLADMLQDYREWHLVPQWRWAVGSPAQLAAVWKHYGIAVKVTTQKIAGTTINYITHTEAAYILDGSGHERALFLWPFYSQDVKRVLSQVA